MLACTHTHARASLLKTCEKPQALQTQRRGDATLSLLPLCLPKSRPHMTETTRLCTFSTRQTQNTVCPCACPKSLEVGYVCACVCSRLICKHECASASCIHLRILHHPSATQLRQHSPPTRPLTSERMSGRQRNGPGACSSYEQRREAGLLRDLEGGRKNRRGDRRSFKRQSEGSDLSEGRMRHLEKRESAGQAGNCSCPKMIHWGKFSFYISFLLPPVLQPLHLTLSRLSARYSLL